MVENPITGLLGIMQSQGAKNNPTVCLVGRVTSVSPFKIQAGGVTLDADDVLVNAALLPGYERDISYSGPVCETSGTNGTVTLINYGLKANDLVLLIPSSDGQQYYVICKLEAV